MATLYLPSSGGYSSGTYVRYRIEVVEGAISGRTRSIKVYVKYWRTNTGYTTYGSGTCYCTINGTSYSQSISSSQTVTYNSYTTFFSKTVTVSYDNYGNASIPIKAYSSTNVDNLNSSSNGGTLKLTNIGAVKYTVTYNANGGSGAPASQTKTYGTALTLRSGKPTRTGYTFQGWGTSASATTVSYAAGGSYTTNAAITLYAVWKANTYTVTYNANGGSGAPASQTKTYGTALTLSSTKPTRTNYTFQGWGTSASATTVSYAAGGSYTTNAAITLYAVWVLAYTKPSIHSLIVSRCNSEGTYDDSGTYFKVDFVWNSDVGASSVQIDWTKTGDTTITGSETFTVNGNLLGTFNKTLGSGGILTDASYSVSVYVYDSIDYAYEIRNIPSILLPIDVLATGTGVAIGKAAEKAGFDVKFPSYFNNTIYDQYNTKIQNGMANYTTEGIDPNTTLEHLILTNNSKVPTGSGYWYIKTEFYANKSTSSNRMQTAYPYYGGNSANAAYHRYYYNGAWSDWIRSINGSEEVKILWSGAIFMNGSQSITLSEPISSQRTGIILHWQAYDYTDYSGVYNWDHNYTYIPKSHVLNYSGSSVSCTVSNGSFAYIGSKYVYISDSTITGHSNNITNQKTISDSGTITTTIHFVLSQVLGV